MFFFNTNLRRVHIPSGTFYQRCQPIPKLGHSCLVFGCLTMVFGLLSLLLTISHEENKFLYVLIGSFCLIFGSFLTILTCFFEPIVNCYNNWIYRTRVTPTQIEPTNPTVRPMMIVSTAIHIIDEN